MLIAAVHAPAGVFSRIDVGQFRSSHDPPNGGQRGASKGDAEELRVDGRAAGNRGPNAGSQASTEHCDKVCHRDAWAYRALLERHSGCGWSA